MGLMAIEDILEGPQRMHRDVLKRLPELRELRKGYDDSRAQTDLDLFPTAGRKKPPRRGKEPTAPKTKLAKVKNLATGAVRQVLPVRAMAKERPEANVPHIDLKWWLLAQFDSALVSSADGSAASWYKRDPALFRDLLARSVTLHARLTREWPALVEQYKAALPELSSPDTWKSTFDESTKLDEPVS
jgi:galactofuranosylgalactofuranosylrhamnosyl-N-acetylglucosaminyl-diphospho-decaprenol beta-1,5/1,6-galactofuranosyltransferase